LGAGAATSVAGGVPVGDAVAVGGGAVVGGVLADPTGCG
jgi:hypothetical protein